MIIQRSLSTNYRLHQACRTSIVTATFATAVGLPLTLGSINQHYFLYTSGIFSFTRAAPPLGPIILLTPLTGCVIGLSPPPGNTLALLQ